jgi:DNA-binding winged helix-turn-helix (wHTH) protein/TolB-like protein/predicted Zn-dependent protease
MGDSPADDRLYAFGDVVVDPRAHRVQRAGADVALEPKAYAVLLVLLREAGAIVPRDALLDAVWGHRHVTPAVLNRVIAMLRRALGDDADQPRWIRTVYGTGYGFVGAVQREARAPETAVETRPADSASAPIAPISTPAVDPPPVAAAKVAPPRRTALGVAAAALIAVLAGAALWSTRGTAPAPPPPADPVAPAEPAAPSPVPAAVAPLRIAVLPLSHDGDDPAVADLASGLTDSLIETLSRQPQVAVTARESADRAAASGDSPEATIAALGVDALLRASLRIDADGTAHVDAALLHRDGARPLLLAYQRPRAQVFRVLGPLLDDLGRSGIPLGVEAGGRALRDSSERVQDLYWQAQLLAAGTDRDEPGTSGVRALAKLDELLAVDPDFALAHALRASMYTRQGNMGVLSIGEAGERARAAAERAIALAPDLAEGHLALGYANTMQWRSIDALGPAQRALEIAPNDYRALSLMGNVLAYLGRIDESRRYNERAMVLNPLLPWVMVRNGWTNVLGGRPDEALADIARLQAQLGPGMRRFIVPRIHIAYGQLAQAMQTLGPPTPDEPALGAAARAAALQLLGDTDAAGVALRNRNIKLPAPPIYLDTLLRQALLEGRAGEFAQSLERSDPPPAQPPWLGVARATALAHAGDRRSALRELSRLFADPRQRELVAYSWFIAHSGLSRIADWIALRREQGVAHASELAAHDAFITSMHDGGVRAPMLAYHRAVSAALHDDPAAADKLLGEAIAAGWLDPIALRFDFAWTPYADEAWLARRRDELAARVQEQRRLAGMR